MFKTENCFTKVKYLCHLLLISLLSTLLVSCSYSRNSLPVLDKEKPVSISFWHHYMGEQKVLFDNLVAEFNKSVGKEKGITVKAYSMDNTGDIHKKLISSANGEPGSPAFPEMATAYPGTAYTLYQMDKLVSIDKYMTGSELGMYEESFLDEGRLTSDSGVVIFPVAKSTEVLYINYTFYKQFLNEYNIENPAEKLNEDMLSTFEGIRQTAEAYYNWTDAKTPDIANDGKALFGFDAASNFSIIAFHQLGKEFFNPIENGLKINLESPVMKSVWNEYFVPMVKGHYGEYSFYRSEDLQTGDLIMYAGSTAGAGFFPKTVTTANNEKYDIELKVLPYPAFKSGKKASVQQGAGVIVAKSEPEKEYASVVFLKWFTEPDRNVDFVLKTGYLPVTKDALKKILPEKLKAFKDDNEYKNVVKVLNATLDMMKNYNLYTYKPFEGSDEIRYAFEDKLLSYTKNARETFVKRVSEGSDYGTELKDAVSVKVFDQFIAEVKNEILKAK